MGIISSIMIEPFANCVIFQPPLRENDYEYSEEYETYYVGDSHVVSVKPNIEKDKDIVIIFSHGNGCDNQDLHTYYRYLSDTYGVIVIGYDYSGYGKSKGLCAERNCYNNLESIVDDTKEKYKNKKIILMGHSLGTGVTVHYAMKKQWEDLIILLSPYKSMKEVANDMSSMSSFIPTDYFVSIDKINHLNCPVKIFHGTNDTIIHHSHSKELYSKLNPNFKIFKPSYINCEHNDIIYKCDIAPFFNYHPINIPKS